MTTNHRFSAMDHYQNSGKLLQLCPLSAVAAVSNQNHFNCHHYARRIQRPLDSQASWRNHIDRSGEQCGDGVFRPLLRVPGSGSVDNSWVEYSGAVTHSGSTDRRSFSNSPKPLRSHRPTQFVRFKSNRFVSSF